MRFSNVLAASALVVVGTTQATVLPATAAPVQPVNRSVTVVGSACALNADTGESHCAATAKEARRAVVGTSSGALVLARFYEHINFQGASMTMYGFRPCTITTSDKDYTRGDLGSSWNDKISSLKTYNRCDARLYEDVHGGGKYTGFIDANSDLRSYPDPWWYKSWNDEASSIRLS